jgi:hypothetical protein
MRKAGRLKETKMALFWRDQEAGSLLADLGYVERNAKRPKEARNANDATQPLLKIELRK